MENRRRRAALVIVSNFPRPFRVHVYQRIAREIENLTVHTFYYRAGQDYLANVELPADINATVLAGAQERSGTRWWGRPMRDFGKARRLNRHLDAHASAIRAVILDGYATIITIPLLRHCARLGIPVFIRGDSNIRNDHPRGLLQRWLKPRLLRWVVRHSAGFMPMASLGQQYFEKYGASPDRCFWVPSIPDYKVFADVPEADVARAREDLGIDPTRNHLLFAGRFIPCKRIDQLIQAMVRIADDRPDWDLLMAGDGPIREELGRSVPAAYVSRIKWLGFQGWERLRLIYKIAHVLVLPSESEAWGVVIMEAMAAGETIVASDIVAAAVELVDDGVSGRIHRAGDLDGLTAALLDVTDPRRSESYRRAVPESLARWQRDHDPVDGVRAALRSVDAVP